MIIAATPAQVKPFPRDRVTWLLIAGLLFFRFPLIYLASFVPSTANWAFPLSETGTYFLIAILIFWERDRLVESNIDSLAVGLLLIKPVELLFYRRYISGPFTSPALWLYIPIAIGLAIALLVRHPNLRRPTGKNLVWLAIGVVIGMGMGIGIGYVFNHFQVLGNIPYKRTFAQIFASPGGWQPYLLAMLTHPLQQLFYAGGMEEPLFRGFLWGALRRVGWKDGWICLFQAGLFCLGHIYYVPTRLFWSWGYTFLAALVFGLLAWKSRSIATSMLAHGVANAWGDIFGHMIRW